MLCHSYPTSLVNQQSIPIKLDLTHNLIWQWDHVRNEHEDLSMKVSIIHMQYRPNPLSLVGVFDKLAELSW